MSTKITVHFTITGRFDPNEVTKRLGMNPSKAWKFGDTIQKTLTTYKHDGWKLSTEEIDSLDLNEPLNQIWEIIQPHKTEIIDICNDLSLETEFSCVVEVEEDEYPTLHFDSEMIKQISELKADIDIDIF